MTRVGKCQACHTPHNERGEEIKEKSIQVSPLPFQPIVQMSCAGTSPPIAGLQGWTDAPALKFLQTGITKDGKTATPSVPEYRLDAEDAVVTYLRSPKEPKSKAGNAHTEAAEELAQPVGEAEWAAPFASPICHGLPCATDESSSSSGSGIVDGGSLVGNESASVLSIVFSRIS